MSSQIHTDLPLFLIHFCCWQHILLPLELLLRQRDSIPCTDSTSHTQPLTTSPQPCCNMWHSNSTCGTVSVHFTWVEQPQPLHHAQCFATAPLKACVTVVLECRAPPYWKIAIQDVRSHHFCGSALCSPFCSSCEAHQCRGPLP